MKKSLTRKERLSGKKEIDTLFAQATRREGDGLRLLLRPNNCAYNRVLVTTRRGFSSAVARNRQKRIFREIFRLCKGSLKQGFDLGFVLKKEEMSFPDMRISVARLLERADVLEKS
jgi:ribonuclease P protein component